MIEYKECIEILKGWAETRGLEVCRGFGFDAYFHEEKHIVYNHKLRNKTNQIYSLLHECGHAIAFNDKRSYKLNFPTLYKQRFTDKKTSKRTNRYKMEIIFEEYDAWRRGYRLANKLGLDIDSDKYFAYAARWVKTYTSNDVGTYTYSDVEI